MRSVPRLQDPLLSGDISYAYPYRNRFRNKNHPPPKKYPKSAHSIHGTGIFTYILNGWFLLRKICRYIYCDSSHGRPSRRYGSLAVVFSVVPASQGAARKVLKNWRFFPKSLSQTTVKLHAFKGIEFEDLQSAKKKTDSNLFSHQF